jgi:hypothetical protein
MCCSMRLQNVVQGDLFSSVILSLYEMNNGDAENGNTIMTTEKVKAVATPPNTIVSSFLPKSRSAVRKKPTTKPIYNNNQEASS